MRHFVLWIILTASVCAPQAVFAETLKSEQPEPDELPPRANFGPLTLDVMLAGGLSAELYLHGEPAFDLGIVRLGKSGAIGVGGGIDVGWCALCSVVSALSDLDWRGSFYAPFFRSTVHAGTLGGLIPATEDAVDLYVGALVGPSFYTFEVRSGSSSAKFERVTVRFAPLIGGRLGFAQNRFLLFGEYRFNIEGGFSAVTYTDENGDEQVVMPDSVDRRGNEFIVGIGVRF